MTVRSWVQIDGELVPKHLAPSNERPGATGPNIIVDSIDPFQSQADGKVYTSKSAYRRELKARGYREVGNDRISKPATKPADGDVRRDIEQAIEGAA
ncbi:hypothetical protein [Salinisphaera sp.]|uniref:hypothetical protein n=1 Tax=Salinisphaera sp. TaxID=1914330 RepID=UPI000C53A616|nr:hypothetical protein [Salinisphaera sp.]MAS09916.1 hypothetical protein [Salinisphaera sp.]|tara:strand:+ start:30386 stop:30676 length:291 start_codon:yes stop_codon:yes gene_type:complete